MRSIEWYHFYFQLSDLPNPGLRSLYFSRENISQDDITHHKTTRFPDFSNTVGMAKIHLNTCTIQCYCQQVCRNLDSCFSILTDTDNNIQISHSCPFLPRDAL